MTTKTRQIEKFREAARELGTDDREEVFDRALKRVASAPPAKKADKPKKAKNEEAPRS